MRILVYKLYFTLTLSLNPRKILVSLQDAVQEYDQLCHQLGWVYFKRFGRRGDVDDFIQDAREGLIRAYAIYDPDSNLSFAKFVNYKIRQQMMNGLYLRSLFGRRVRKNCKDVTFTYKSLSSDVEPQLIDSEHSDYYEIEFDKAVESLSQILNKDELHIIELQLKNKGRVYTSSKDYGISHFRYKKKLAFIQAKAKRSGLA